MIDNIINFITNKNETKNSDISASNSRKKVLKTKIISIFIEDSTSESSQNTSIKDSIIDIFTEDDTDKKVTEKDDKKSNNTEEKDKIVQTNNTDSKDYVPDDYKNLSDREKHILKLDKLNKDVGSGECPTCKEESISVTSIEIQDKNKSIEIHSCENAGCHRYIYPGDRDTVGILRDKLKDKNILKKTLK